jgi:hypothetical protein
MHRKDFINLSGPIDASCLWATQTPPHTRAVRPLHKRGLDWVEPARCPYRDTLQIHLQGAPSAIHMRGWPCARLSCVCKADGSGTTHCRRLSHLNSDPQIKTCSEGVMVAGKSWSARGGLNQTMFGAMGVGEVVGGSSKTAC